MHAFAFTSHDNRQALFGPKRGLFLSQRIGNLQDTLFHWWLVMTPLFSSLQLLPLDLLIRVFDGFSLTFDPSCIMVKRYYVLRLDWNKSAASSSSWQYMGQCDCSQQTKLRQWNTPRFLLIVSCYRNVTPKTLRGFQGDFYHYFLCFHPWSSSIKKKFNS